QADDGGRGGGGAVAPIDLCRERGRRVAGVAVTERRDRRVGGRRRGLDRRREDHLALDVGGGSAGDAVMGGAGRGVGDGRLEGVVAAVGVGVRSDNGEIAVVAGDRARGGGGAVAPIDAGGKIGCDVAGVAGGERRDREIGERLARVTADAADRDPQAVGFG